MYVIFSKPRKFNSADIFLVFSVACSSLFACVILRDSKHYGRRRGRVVRAVRLWCGKSPYREFEARLRHAATGKLSLSTQQKMGTFFELGKDKAAKGEGWAPPFISCAQDTVVL